MLNFMADVEWRGIADMILPVVAVSISLTIPIVAMIIGHLQKKEKMRLAEKAIEHGVDISHLKFDDECKPGPRLPYRAGMVTASVGFALCLVAYFKLLGGFPIVLATVGGAVCLCVGLALLANDWINREKLG